MATSLPAQGMLGGFLLDQSSGEPLPCVEVWLLGRSDSVLQVARTRQDGQFQFTVWDTLTARLQFVAWGVDPEIAPVGHVASDSMIARNFRVQFHPPTFRAMANLLERQPLDSATGPVPRNRRAVPDYPTEMAGVGGEVIVRYVVDSTGVVRRDGIRTLGSSDPLFTSSVHGFLARTRFVPGMRGARPVCESVTQRFQFAAR